MKKIIFSLFIFLTLSFILKAQQFVVGYYSNNEWNNLASEDLSELTHLNIAFANPNENGDLVTYNQEEIRKLIPQIKKKGIKVLLSAAGGGLNHEQKNIWAEKIKPANVNGFIDRMIALLEDYGYDGLDLDFEHNDFFNLLGSNYAPFAKKLSAKLKEHNLLFTTALFGTYKYSAVTSEILELFDFINIMTYDATGSWNLNNPGQHSPIKLAVDGINFWVNQGVPRNKIILGLPFYGWDFDDEPDHPWRDVTYEHMVNKNEDYAYLDNVGKKYYNGIPTILTKTILSENECGGVMIWHISCDINGKYSLLNTIKKGQSEYRGNVARNKTATSTELEIANKNPASNATDGNPTTRWAGKPINPGYLTIDLGKNTNISSMTIDWEDSYAKSFEIQVSEDNSNWSTIKTFTSQELLVVSNHALQRITDLDNNARYVRLKMTEGTKVNGQVWCYSIWDIRIFGQEITMPEEVKIPFSNELYNPNAKSDRNLEITLHSSDSSIAKVVDNMIQLIKPGNVEITATQDGNEEYGPAVIKYQYLNIESASLVNEYENNNINVFPVPAKDFITIQGLNINESIKIYTTTGKLILETTEKKINISNLNSGVYILTSGKYKKLFVKE